MLKKPLKDYYPIQNIIFILSLSLICIFYFMYFHSLIPGKFTVDAVTIMKGITDASYAPSYRNVSILFQWLGVNSSNALGPYAFFIGWIIFQLFLLLLLKINRNKLFSLSQIIFIIFFTVMYGVYFDALSKDLVLIFFLLIFINFYMRNENFNYLIIFIILYSLFFRGYWIILFFLSLLINIIKGLRLRKSLLYIILFFVIIITLYHLFNNNFITDYRISINSIRMNSPYARSMIQNILPNDNLLSDIINYIYVLITLFIPIQGFKSTNVIIYYIWIISLFILIIKYNEHLNIKLLLLLFGYINMQALFEPDIGSAFRHQLALFPLIYYLLSNCINEGE